MLNFIKGAISSIVSTLLKILRGTIIRSLKIEALKLYIRVVAIARNISILMLTAVSFLLLGAVAFVMVHAGILILLPYSLETKGWIILILGIIYGLFSLCFIRYICSEKTWLELSKASEMMNDIMKK